MKPVLVLFNTLGDAETEQNKNKGGSIVSLPCCVELEGVVAKPAELDEAPLARRAAVRFCPVPHKKTTPKRVVFVELGGVEPPSKQLTSVLSTCLSDGWL